MAVSAAQKKASEKYLEKLDEVRIRMKKGRRDVIKAHADARGESVNGFINRAIDETMQRDGQETQPPVSLHMGVNPDAGGKLNQGV